MRRRRRARRGFTLLEVIVAIAVLVLTVALVAPSLATPRPRPGTFERVIDVARQAAIARAQSLALAFAQDGRWSLRALPPDDSLELSSGQVDIAPSIAFRLRLTPLGACLAEERLPPEMGAWDAARCSAQTAATRAP